MAIFFAVVGVCVVAFGFVVIWGAPYVPTHRKWVQRVVDRLPKTGRVVDLGCGDGILTIAAARAGHPVLGVELNPILTFVSWLRTRRYRRLVRIKLGNFWYLHLPEDTSVVFVFLAGPFMARLERYMQAEANRLGRSLTLISYGFRLPSSQPDHVEGPLMVYQIQPHSLQTRED